MNKLIKLALLVVCFISGNAIAAADKWTDKWTGDKKATSVQVLQNGGLIIYLDSEVNAACTMAGTNSIYALLTIPRAPYAVLDSSVYTLSIEELIDIQIVVAASAFNQQVKNASNSCDLSMIGFESLSLLLSLDDDNHTATTSKPIITANKNINTLRLKLDCTTIGVTI